MKNYTVLYAEDIPHYGAREFDAANDELAIQRAIDITPEAMSAFTNDPDHNNPQCRRIVHIEGPDGIVAEGIYLDRQDAIRLFATQMLEALEAGQSRNWVANAGITDDIEALRRICLAHADWWNNIAWPLIAKARGQQ